MTRLEVLGIVLVLVSIGGVHLWALWCMGGL